MCNFLLLAQLPYNVFRVNHARDWIVHLPPKSYKNYTHHMTEIWYRHENMNAKADYIVCAYSDENASCSDDDWLFSLEDHIYYFNKWVSGYGMTGCNT